MTDEEFLEDIFEDDAETEWEEWEQADNAQRYRDIQTENRRLY